MSNKRAKNMKNYAAKRRKSRRIESARASQVPAGPRQGIPNLTITRSRFSNNGIDILNKGGYIVSEGSSYESGVENHDGGRFDSHRDNFK